MINTQNEYTFLIDGKEKIVIMDMSTYSAKKRAKRVAGAGVDCQLIEVRKNWKPRKENKNDN